MVKVELLVNLKVKDGRIIDAGTIYTDEHGPIPDFIIRRLNRGMARILSGSVLPQVNTSEVKTQREATTSPELQPSGPPPKAPKKPPVKVQNQQGPASTDQGVAKNAKPAVRKPIIKKK
jgi:hypothetical protein